MEGGELKEETLPPGFRFHPADEELITYYLINKISDANFTARAIGDVDLNKSEPWDLPGKAKMGEKEWYFFSQRDRKYPTGVRTNRATSTGYWKTTGKDKEIYNSNTLELVGMKKTLVFYRGRAPRGEKSNWVMHEYRIHSKSVYRSTKDDWVVCRVFQKSGGGKKYPPNAHSSSRPLVLHNNNNNNPYSYTNLEMPNNHQLQMQIQSQMMMIHPAADHNFHQFPGVRNYSISTAPADQIQEFNNRAFFRGAVAAPTGYLPVHVGPVEGGGVSCFTVSGLNHRAGVTSHAQSVPQPPLRRDAANDGVAVAGGRHHLDGGYNEGGREHQRHNERQVCGDG